MIVVDTNIIAYALIKGEHTDLARKVREIDPQWRVPFLWRYEFLNILTIYVHRSGLSEKQALDIWERAVETFSVCEHSVHMSMSLKISCEYKITAYDAQFILLAQSLNTFLVTQDKILLKIIPKSAIAMGNFIAQSNDKKQ